MDNYSDWQSADLTNALNTAADQSRVIAVLTEALEHYADDMNWDECTIIGESERMSYDNGYIGSDQAGHIVAQKALAEAKRIQEGK